MGYIRKALSITTLGLSNLVLDDDSKGPAPSPQKRTPARKRPTSKAKPKARARAKTVAGSSAGEHKAARAKPRPTRAKPKAKANARTTRARTAPPKPARRATAKAAPPPQPTVQESPKADAAEAPAPARPVAPTSGVAIALDRIAKLHQHGELTDREFAAAKARILGTAPPPAAPETDSASFPSIEANVAAARRLADYAERDRDRPATGPGATRGI